MCVLKLHAVDEYIRFKFLKCSNSNEMRKKIYFDFITKTRVKNVSFVRDNRILAES